MEMNGSRIAAYSAWMKIFVSHYGFKAQSTERLSVLLSISGRKFAFISLKFQVP
jgi:hypothetical protein